MVLKVSSSALYIFVISGLLFYLKSLVVRSASDDYRMFRVLFVIDFFRFCY